MSTEIQHSCSINVILETKLFSFILGIEGIQKSPPCGAQGPFSLEKPEALFHTACFLLFYSTASERSPPTTTVHALSGRSTDLLRTPPIAHPLPYGQAAGRISLQSCALCVGEATGAFTNVEAHSTWLPSSEMCKTSQGPLWQLIGEGLFTTLLWVIMMSSPSRSSSSKFALMRTVWEGDDRFHV